MCTSARLVPMTALLEQWLPSRARAPVTIQMMRSAVVLGRAVLARATNNHLVVMRKSQRRRQGSHAVMVSRTMEAQARRDHPVMMRRSQRRRLDRHTVAMALH